MSSSFSSCVAAIGLALIATHPAKADTYKITIVDHTQNENFLGIDDKGDFVVNDSNNSLRTTKFSLLRSLPLWAVAILLHYSSCPRLRQRNSMYHRPRRKFCATSIDLGCL
jgi:hypothetical protein